jgi:hypothetical protein
VGSTAVGGKAGSAALVACREGEQAGRTALPFAVLSLQESGVWARLCLSPGFVS